MRKSIKWIIGIIIVLAGVLITLLYCPYFQNLMHRSTTTTVESPAPSNEKPTLSNKGVTENTPTSMIGNLPMAPVTVEVFQQNPAMLFGYNNPNNLIMAIHQKTLNILGQAGNLNPLVLQYALRAYACAHAQKIGNPRYLTIIDYSLPSTQKRMWVIDLKTATVSFHTLVAHGKNSGFVKTTSFSNLPGSDESSIGLFLTANTYMGHNGYSLKLNGLEKGFNSNAMQREVVIHGAAYVNDDFVNRYGRLGRSWGCPALSKLVSTPVINEIKNGTLVFSYYPQQQWLDNSTFLHCPVALPWKW